MKLWWRSTSFAPRRSGFDSRRLHSHGAAAEATHPLGFLVVASAKPETKRREYEGSNPSGSIFASVVSTAARALCTAEVRVQLLPEASLVAQRKSAALRRRMTLVLSAPSARDRAPAPQQQNRRARLSIQPGVLFSRT
jgi:hypothetical protein